MLAGVRQSLATVGALAGSAVASVVFLASGQSYVVTFAAASVPPTLALAWLLFTFRDELAPMTASEASAPSSPAEGETVAPQVDGGAAKKEEDVPLMRKAMLLVSAFKPAYWQALTVVCILYFGRFDFAWVTLRAQAVRFIDPHCRACYLILYLIGVLMHPRLDKLCRMGHASRCCTSSDCSLPSCFSASLFCIADAHSQLGAGLTWSVHFLQCAVPKAMLPALASATMLATTLTALTTGRVAKGKGVSVRNALLVAGFAVLLAANVLFAAPISANIPGMFAACFFVGVHMGMTHGLTLSMLSSYMPQDNVPGAACPP